MADIFRFFNPITNSHYFAVGEAERTTIAALNPGWLNEGRAFGADTVPSPGSVDVVRFYNPATDRYLFSANTIEHAIIQQQGWVKQITVFQVFPTDGSGTAVGATTGVVRIYVSALDSHVYSSNPIEIGILSQLPGAIVEGAAYFISPTGTTTTPVDPTTPTTDAFFDLTTSADTPGAVAPAKDTQGTDGNDEYRGVFGGLPSDTTISSIDILDGKGGIDSLKVTVAVIGSNGTTISPTATSVEHVYITNKAVINPTSPFTLDMTKFAGETEVWDLNSIQGSTTRATNVDMGTIVGMDGSKGSYQVNFSGDRSGFSDSLSLTLKGVGSATSPASFSVLPSPGATDSLFETINITSKTSPSNLKLGLDSQTLNTINVTGDAALTITPTNDFFYLNHVYASTLTADFFFDAQSSQQSVFLYEGGSGLNHLVVNSNSLGRGNGFKGGINNQDTLSVVTVAPRDLPQQYTSPVINSMEYVNVSGPLGAKIDFASSSGIVSVRDSAIGGSSYAGAQSVGKFEFGQKVGDVSFILGGVVNGFGSAPVKTSLNIDLSGTASGGGGNLDKLTVVSDSLASDIALTVNINSIGTGSLNNIRQAEVTGTGSKFVVTGDVGLSLTLDAASSAAVDATNMTGRLLYTGNDLANTVTAGAATTSGGLGNYINTGKGQDTVNLSNSFISDKVSFEGVITSADFNTVRGFVSGGGGDVISINASDTSAGTSASNPPVIQTVASAAAFSSFDTSTNDILELEFAIDSSGGAVAALLAAIGTNNIGGDGVRGSGSGYIVAYSTANEALLFYVEDTIATATPVFQSSEIEFVGILTNVSMGSLTSANFDLIP